MNVYAFSSLDVVRLQQRCDEVLLQLNANPDNVIRFNASDIDINDILEELRTQSLFADTKYIIVTHPIFLLDDYKDDFKIKDFISYFNNPNPDVYLFLLIDFKVSNSNEIIRALKNCCDIESVLALSDLDPVEYVREEFASSNAKINTEAIEMLISMTDGDSVLLSSEIDKLILYSEGNEITVNMIKDIVPKHLEDNIYDLINLYLEKRTKQVLEVYYDLRLANEDEIRIMNAFINKVEEIYYTKVLLKKGLKQEDIANYCKVKKGKAFYMIKNAKNISDKALVKLIHRLGKLDLDIKSGKLDKRSALELFLLGVE